MTLWYRSTVMKPETWTKPYVSKQCFCVTSKLSGVSRISQTEEGLLWEGRTAEIYVYVRVFVHTSENPINCSYPALADRGGAPLSRTPGSKFLHFHAVFGKNWPNIACAPCRVGAPLSGKSWTHQCATREKIAHREKWWVTWTGWRYSLPWLPKILSTETRATTSLWTFPPKQGGLQRVTSSRKG